MIVDVSKSSFLEKADNFKGLLDWTVKQSKMPKKKVLDDWELETESGSLL